MNQKTAFSIVALSLCGLIACARPTTNVHKLPDDTLAAVSDTVAPVRMYLVEEDFEKAAERLGVEVATIKAVVEVEAGSAHKGFWKDGKPLINFSINQFRTNARKRGVNLSKYTKSHPIVFSGASRQKYGSQQAAVQARLDAARSIHDTAAIEATFWGMFQIGGFNWKLCGLSSPQELAERMSRSESDQLELFINFIENTGLKPKLQAKDWSGFARGYNGPSYLQRGYHTKLARAYAKHNKPSAKPAEKTEEKAAEQAEEMGNVS